MTAMTQDLNIDALTNAGNVKKLLQQLSGVKGYYTEDDPEAANKVEGLIQREIEDSPDLAKIKVRATPGLPGAYFPGNNAIALGVVNPSALAHELGHAKNMQHSTMYKSLLMSANRLADINRSLSVPTMLAIRTLVKNKEKRNEILNILSGASAALAAPGLAEEFGASMNAMKYAPDKIQAIKTLVPAFLQHTLHSAMPVVTYQAGKLF